MQNNILIKENSLWKRIKRENRVLWFKGYLFNSNPDKVFKYLSQVSSKSVSSLQISLFLKELDGHFSFIWEGNGFTIASVDKISSVPLYYLANKTGLYIGNDVIKIKEMLGEDLILDPYSALEVSMSGYTIGNKTLYKALYQLTAGEFILFDNGELHKEYYYTYKPYKSDINDMDSLSTKLTDVIIKTLQDTINLASGRQIAIPLSAGKDSRLIVSGLRHLGYKNIVCFSYGRKGQYEEKTAEKIANKLGVEWYFIELNYRKQRSFFQSDLFKRYMERYNKLSGAPHIQEVSAVYHLLNSGVVSKNAIFINGNTGDFISGGHIKKDMINSAGENVYAYFLDKHYSLWNQFRSKKNDETIVSSLERELSERGIEVDFGSFHNTYETLEYLGRQSKYIPKMMNVFEYFKHDWIIPFWSNTFLDFWEAIPFEYKLNQDLYNYTLVKNDWGGVWRSIPCNDTNIRPITVLLVRNICKIFFLFLDRKKWRKFDNKWFMYWYDPAVIMPFVKYSEHCLDNNSPRSSLSWVSKEFLLANGIYQNRI